VEEIGAQLEPFARGRFAAATLVASDWLARLMGSQ